MNEKGDILIQHKDKIIFFKEKVGYKNFTTEIIVSDLQRKIFDNGIKLRRKMWNTLVEIYNSKVDNYEIIIPGKSALDELEDFLWERFTNEMIESGLGTRFIREVAKAYRKAWLLCFNQSAANSQPTIDKGQRSKESFGFVDSPGKIKEIKTKTKTGKEKIIQTFTIPRWIGKDRFKGMKNHYSQSDMTVRLKGKSLHKHFFRQFKGSVIPCENRIIKHNERFYLLICYKYEVVKQPCPNQSLGLDWGLVDYYIDSSGNRYNLPKKVIQQTARIRRLNKVLSKKSKGSKNFQKVKQKLLDAYLRRDNLKKEWRRQFIKFLLTNYNLLVLENLDLLGLISKSSSYRKEQILNNSHYLFVRELTSAAENYECTVVLIDQYFPSSQVCSECGKNTGKKPVSIRSFICPYCGTHHDRDINAARNILNRGKVVALSQDSKSRVR